VGVCVKGLLSDWSSTCMCVRRPATCHDTYQPPVCDAARPQDAKVVDDTMRKYDTNRSGKLEQSQLALMLKDMNGGFDVTKEELAWVFYKADTCTGRRNYGVDHGEILYAIRIWKGYLENREYLDHMFEKYDTGRTGQLAFAELKVLLTDLTDPDEPPPSDKEVKQVRSSPES